MVGWSILGILLIAVATLLLARFVFNKQVEAYLCNSLKNEMVEKLKDAGKYVPDTTSYHFAYQKDSVQSQKIREYFKLDTVLSSTMPTWDKAISLARFVAENIPHANQKINPKRCNAIDLWKYYLLQQPRQFESNILNIRNPVLAFCRKRKTHLTLIFLTYQTGNELLSLDRANDL